MDRAGAALAVRSTVGVLALSWQQGLAPFGIFLLYNLKVGFYFEMYETCQFFPPGMAQRISLLAL